MTRFARLVSGHRSKFVVLAAWLVALAALGPLIGSFESKQQNEPSSFLPGDAESVRALELSDQFPSAEGVAGIVVFSREGGLTPAEAVSRSRTSRRSSTRIPPDGVVFSEPASARRGGRRSRTPRRSDRHRRADEEILIEAVDSVRETVSGKPADGPRGESHGPGRLLGRCDHGLRGVNSTLSSAASPLVLVLLVLSTAARSWVLPLLVVFFAEPVLRGIGSLLVDAGVVVNGQTAGIPLVLVFGAGTDYALPGYRALREGFSGPEASTSRCALAGAAAAPGSRLRPPSSWRCCV